MISGGIGSAVGAALGGMGGGSGGIDIRVTPASMKTMSSTFNKAMTQMNDLAGQVDDLADKLDNGALLGEGGRSFSSAIREVLVPKMTLIASKMGELKNDVDKALADHEAAEAKAAKPFGQSA